MRALPATLSSVADAVVDLLAANGTMTVADLTVALEGTALVLGGPAEDLLEELDDAGLLVLVVTLDGGRWAWLPRLVEGRTMTHRLTAAELRYDILATDPDVDAALMVVDDAPMLPARFADQLARFTDGRPVVTAYPDLDVELLEERGVPTADLDAATSYLLLPPGLLASFGAVAGDLVGVTLTPGGWTVAPLPDGAAPADPGRLREAVRTWLDGHEPAGVPELAWWLLDRTDAFTTAELPLSELLEQWGLARRGDMVAREELDLDEWARNGRVDSVASRYGLDPQDARSVVLLHRLVMAADALLEAARDVTTDAERRTLGERVRDLVADGDDVVAPTRALALPDVAEALFAESVGTGVGRAAAMGLLAESLQPVAPPPAQPALHWLVAKAYERTGDVVRAEEALRRAADLAPWPPALHGLARYAADRGNAVEAAALLRRAGIGRGDTELALYDHFAAMAATDLGRNKPCWCGSGRKYKVCHLGREVLPLDERAAWLYQKAGTYLNDGPWRDVLVDVAIERARYAASDQSLYEVVQDGLVTDAVLVEGGAFEAFLAERGPLLPDDEVALGQQWLLIDRSVHEIQAVRPGASLTLRDLRTGDVHVVRERTASRTLRPGTLLCARVLPAGETLQLFGTVAPVRLEDLDDLLALLDDAPGPAELVALLSRRFAPPRLQNTDGEPLAFHEAEFRVADPARLAAHLDTALTAHDDPSGPRTWHDTTEDGMARIRSIVLLAADTVTVEANSDARFERIVTTLHGAGTDLTEVDHQRRTAEEMVELTERFPDLLGSTTGEVHDVAKHPEVAAAIAGLMRSYEDRWLDEPVPALAGQTPRQAVADPTRRDEVVRLLRSWPEPTPQSMDRDRIALMLGLTL